MRISVNFLLFHVFGIDYIRCKNTPFNEVNLSIFIQIFEFLVRNGIVSCEIFSFIFSMFFFTFVK
ncbi:MAG TPA: hypothetical protein DEQ30_10430 [Porphyromonadaceae bacterium]|nr:hypothetical protein [Porphyromonadaceae bacterium]